MIFHANVRDGTGGRWPERAQTHYGNLITSGTFDIDGDGNLTGSTTDGQLTGHVSVDGTGTEFTVDGFLGNGSLNAGTGTGSGTWSNSPAQGTWTANRR